MSRFVMSGLQDVKSSLLFLLFLAVCVACGDSSGGRTTELEEPPISVDDFVGSAACAGCHAEQYGRWAESTHGRAGGEPGPETVIAPFNGAPIVFRDGTVLPVVDSAGRYLFVVRQEGRPEREMTVDGVIGGGHMLGGGTQGFVTRLADGTVRFLPFDYSRHLDAWFCNTASRADRGWQPVTPDLALGDCGDWPPVRILGTMSRFANCQSCHGSQITATFEPGAGVDTHWTSLDINCESCHGPARRHVELMASAASDAAADPAGPNGTGGPAGLVGAADIGLDSRVLDGVDESLEVCFRCHSLGDVVRDDYLSGAPLADYYALLLPALGDEPHLADGRVRTFAYQGAHLSSSCYVDGTMTCVSCHEPHGLGYWDVNRVPLVSETDDRQCTSCHASKAADPEAHTFHPAGSPGARCVSCHMPYLQHPVVGDDIPFARSDHSIPIPRPQLDGRLGLVSACRGCHTDESELRLQAWVDERWGVTKPQDPVTAGLLNVTDGMGSDLAARLLLRPGEGGDMDQARGLGRYLMGWVRLGEGLDRDGSERIALLAESEDPDLRAMALVARHVAAPARGAASADGARDADEVAAAARNESDQVRRRWVMLLGFLADEARAREDWNSATELLNRALAVTPEDPGVLLTLGLVRSGAGDPQGAIDALTGSLAADPDQPIARVNLGIVRGAAGDEEGAVREYEAAIALNPYEAMAYVNLGNLYLRRDNTAQAIRFYERAVAVGPEIGAAHRNLAVALGRAGRFDEAIPHARRAVEFAPGDQAARDILRQLEAQAGGGAAR